MSSTPLDLRIDAEHVQDMFVKGMSSMGFTHEHKGYGFTCSMHEFTHCDGLTINVALPLVPMSIREIRQKIKEVYDAITNPPN